MWNKPPAKVASLQKPAAEVETPKPVLRCTPEMALEMLRQLKECGMDPGGVTIEIISS